MVVVVALFFIGAAISGTIILLLLLVAMPLSFDNSLLDLRDRWSVAQEKNNETTDVLPSAEPYRRIFVISISVLRIILKKGSLSLSIFLTLPHQVLRLVTWGEISRSDVSCQSGMC